MSDEEALLRAIAAQPDEDTPRLAYADWLDEHASGEAERARAEFIRVQIELDHLPDWGDDIEEDRRDDLAARERQLLATHKRWWIKPQWPSAQSFRRDGITFRRGFAEAGAFRTDELRDHAADIHGHPLLRRLSVSALDVFTLDYLLELPWLEEVRGLELVVHRDPQFGLPDWSKFAACRRFRSLRAIEFGHAAPVAPDVAARLAANDSLAGVRDLRFWEPSGEHATRAMLSGRAFASLALLEVYHFGAGSTGALLAIGENPRCAALERLLLNAQGGRGVEVDEVAAFTRTACWSSLRELRLRGGTITDGALRALGQGAAGLETLSLHRNRLTSLRGLGGPALTTVCHLDLSANQRLTSLDLNEIADHAAGLRYLDLTDCRAMGDSAAALIAGSPAFARLRQLDLINAGVGSAGALALAESPHLSDRLSLLLHGCNVDEPAARAALRARFGDRVQW